MLDLARLSVTVSLIALITIGCSSGSANPTVPMNSDGSAISENAPGNNRALWGIWNIRLDASQPEFVIAPARYATAHFDITDWLLPPDCDDCLKIEVNSFDPVTRILDADVTLRNPTHLTGYDVRGILYTNEFGHELRNADAWTSLWDIPGGDDINPFKAFAKEVSHRLFDVDAEHTENYLVYIPVPPNFNGIIFAVDASWPGNCKEPYAYGGFDQNGVLYQFPGASTDIVVWLEYWQSYVNKVTLFAPEITGEDATPLTPIGGIWTLQVMNNTGAEPGDHLVRLAASTDSSATLCLYNYVTITITETDVPFVNAIIPDKSGPGVDLVDVKIFGSGFLSPEVDVRLSKDGEPEIEASNVEVNDASTVTCDIQIPYDAVLGFYDVEVEIPGGQPGIGTGLFEIINPGPFNPVDVTPWGLNFTPKGIVREGNYAYMTTEYRGLHIFDISDSFNPELIAIVPTSGKHWSIDVSNGYAYLSGYNDPVKIIDVDPPESAHIVSSVDVEGKIAVQDNYAFVVNKNNITTIDISSPEDAYIAGVRTDMYKSVVYCLEIEGDYAYLAYKGWIGTHVQVYDISQPIDIIVKGTVKIDGGYVNGMDYLDGYLYVPGGSINIIDVSNPDYPYIAHHKSHQDSTDVVIADGYMFVIIPNLGLDVFKLVPGDILDFITQLELPGIPGWFDIDNGALYIANSTLGLQVVDITDPESPRCKNTTPSVGIVGGLDFTEDYAFTTGGETVKVLDITHPESAGIVKLLDVSENTSGIVVQDGYAYAVGDDLVIIDIDPLESAYTAGSLNYGVWGGIQCIDVENGIAFMNRYGKKQIMIADVDPPDAPAFMENKYINDIIMDIEVLNGYAYAAGLYSLLVLDIDPPGSVNQVAMLSYDWYNKRSIKVHNGYAYFGNGNSLLVADIDPPELTHEVGAHSMTDDVMDVDASGQYLYVANNTGDLQIMNINDPETPYLVQSVEVPGCAMGVRVYNGYAYVWCEDPDGIQIIKLW